MQGYGFENWSHLFTERQLSALTTFGSLISEMGDLLVNDGADREYANAVRTYLALSVGRISNSCSSFAVWERTSNKVAGAFSRQAMPMVWDFLNQTHFVRKLRIGWPRLSGLQRLSSVSPEP